jgi:hypothetical protein
MWWEFTCPVVVWPAGPSDRCTIPAICSSGKARSLMRDRLLLLAVLALISASVPCIAVELPAVVRGSGTVLLMPEPGPLTMTFSKRDLNIYAGADAMPISVRDPVGQEVASITLPDDGDEGRGPHGKELQQETVTVQVQRRGLYRVLFGGGDYMFGMSADCDRYVVESKLVFNDPNTSGRVYFPAPDDAFEIAAAPMHHPGIQTVTLHDATGDLIHEFDLQEPVEDVTYAVSEDEGNRDGLWHWRIAKLDVRLTVPDVKFWTMDPASWFDPQGSHLLLTPKRATRYLQPGESPRFDLVVFPPEDYSGEFDVDLTQPEQEGVRFELAQPSVRPVDYARDRMALPVTAVANERCVAGAEFDAWVDVVAVDNPLAAGRARLQVRIGPSPASEALDLPIVLRPYAHENWQFGYAPEFEPNAAYFDRDNRAWIRHRTEHGHWSAGAQILEDGRFVLREWTQALREKYPGYQRPSSGSGFRGCRWAFDEDGGAWTVMRLSGVGSGFADAVIYTPDRGGTWQSQLINSGLADIEFFTGHNEFDTPVVVGWRTTAPHPARFCAYHDLLLFTPRIEGGELVVPEPVLVSDNCLGGAIHSGAPATLATREGRTHIVWGEVAEEDAPGVPTYIATYDHESGELSEKVFIAHGPPVNDVHNVPAVVLDSEGYIHVVTGAHGDNFFYRRSLEPNDITAGFTEAVKVHDAGWVDEQSDEDGSARQTYIGLVCGPDDTLHLVYRHNRKGVDGYLPDYAYYMGLAYQRKPTGEPWGPVQPLVIPPVGGYSIYYHKLTIDRAGGLWVSYSHWTDQAYQKDFPARYHHRAMITSADGGDTWKLAQTEDFARAARRYGGR